MNIFAPSNVPFFNPSSQERSPGANASATVGPVGKTEDVPKNEQSHSSDNLSNKYPLASDQEVLARSRRAAGKFKPRLPKHSKHSKPPELPELPKLPKLGPPPKPAKPSFKPKPLSGQEAINNTKSIDVLHKKNMFPSLSSQLALSARNSFIGAGVSTLINLPFSVAEHMASKAIVDRVDAQSKMPGAEKKNADGTTSLVDPSATDQQKIDARLEGAEIKTEVLVNSILCINEGPDAKAVGKSPNAPTDTAARLTALEQRMDATQIQMKNIAERYGLVYKPYAAPESASAPTDASRMDVIEKRYAHMNTMLKKLLAAKEIDAGDE